MSGSSFYGFSILVRGEATRTKPDKREGTFPRFSGIFTAYTVAEAGSKNKDISRGKNTVSSLFSVLDRYAEIDSLKPGVDAG